jgi:hypothetical protein
VLRCPTGTRRGGRWLEGNLFLDLPLILVLTTAKSHPPAVESTVRSPAAMGNTGGRA